MKFIPWKSHHFAACDSCCQNQLDTNHETRFFDYLLEFLFIFSGNWQQFAVEGQNEFRHTAKHERTTTLKEFIFSFGFRTQRSEEKKLDTFKHDLLSLPLVSFKYLSSFHSRNHLALPARRDDGKVLNTWRCGMPFCSLTYKSSSLAQWEKLFTSWMNMKGRCKGMNDTVWRGQWN